MRLIHWEGMDAQARAGPHESDLRLYGLPAPIQASPARARLRVHAFPTVNTQRRNAHGLCKMQYIA